MPDRTGNVRQSLGGWWLSRVLPNSRVLAAALTMCATVAVIQPGLGPTAAPPPEADPLIERNVPLELGVAMSPLGRDWDLRELLLQRVRDTGSGWLRVDVEWCSLEAAGPGQVSVDYQGRLDVIADTAKSMGLRMLAQLDCAPTWAGGSGTPAAGTATEAPAGADPGAAAGAPAGADPGAAAGAPSVADPRAAASTYPSDPRQFERVARYLADRYRGRVDGWELWNEPNCIGGCSNGSPEKFVDLLEAGYRGIKAGDPDSTVITGGVSGSDVEWLRRMYAAGAKGWFDALAVHSYQEPVTAAPDRPSEGDRNRLTSLPLVRALMTENGDGTKPIWLTEFGWSTAKTGPRPGVSEANQAKFLRQAVQQIDRDYPYVSHAFWYALRDRLDSTPYENNFGLLHVRGSPKPAFAALQRANGTVPADR